MRQVEHRAMLVEQQKQKVAEAQPKKLRGLFRFFQREPLPYRFGIRSLTFPLQVVLAVEGLFLAALFFDVKYYDVIQVLKTILGLH